MISTGIPLKENKSLTKERLSHSAASLGQPKSISQIISSTSKRFSLKGDCFTPFIKSPSFLTPEELSLVIFHRVYFVTFIERLFPNGTYKRRLLSKALQPIKVHAHTKTREEAHKCVFSE